MKCRIIIFLIFFLSIINLSAQTKRVLFIGNSYTQVNDLPSMVYSLSLSMNKNLIYETHLIGGARFMTHWNNISSSGLLEKIQLGNFDYIVLQGQSQEVAFPDEQFSSDVYQYAKKLDSISKHYNPNSKVVFYMTWGYRYGDPINCQYDSSFCTFWTMTQELYENYLLMASDFNSVVCPVGAAFRKAIIKDSTIVLHSSDNSHPSIKGTYLGASLFYSTFFNDSINSQYIPSGMNSQECTFLQNISNTMIFDSLSYWFQSQQICDKPANLSSESNFTANDSLTVICNLSWDGTSEKYDLRYKKLEEENWLREVVTQNSHQIYLSIGNWQWRVKSLCNDSSQSLWQDTIMTITASINEIKQNETEAKIYYSKEENKIIIDIKNISEDVNIELIDINGREINEFYTMAIDDQIITYIEAKTLKNGLYLIRIKGKKMNSNHKIIKN